MGKRWYFVFNVIAFIWFLVKLEKSLDVSDYLFLPAWEIAQTLYTLFYLVFTSVLNFSWLLYLYIMMLNSLYFTYFKLY